MVRCSHQEWVEGRHGGWWRSSPITRAYAPRVQDQFFLFSFCVQVVKLEYVLSAQNTISRVTLILLWMHPYILLQDEERTDLYFCSYWFFIFIIPSVISNNNTSYFLAPLKSCSHHYIAPSAMLPGQEMVHHVQAAQHWKHYPSSLCFSFFCHV